MINKIVFNKDEYGNYIVTVGKVDRKDGISEIDNIVIGVGVAPTISALCFPEGLSATRLRPSPTTINSNISQSDKKSTESKSLSNKLSSRTNVWFINQNKTVKDMLDYLAEVNMADFSLEKREDGSLYIQGYDNGYKPRGRMTISTEELKYLSNEMKDETKKNKLLNRYESLTKNKLYEEATFEKPTFTFNNENKKLIPYENEKKE